MKGFLIAGISSGVGKTTVAMALMAAFKNVSPFKVGPDYIDPRFHELITGNKSYNLDLFLMGEDGVNYSFYKHKNDISIVEGVMGLFDGIDNSLDNFSSAHIARVLNLPIILVIDGIGKSTSIAAQVSGYLNFDKRLNIIGVIINKVSSEKTYNIFKEAIEKYTDVKCLGYIPKNKNITLESRHLGLVQADEIFHFEQIKKELKELAENYLDLDEIFKLANIEENLEKYNDFKKNFIDKNKNIYKGKKIAIAKDAAFSFYYNDNIELLENLGCEIKFISPLKDKGFQKVDVLYIGGGYPENYLQDLTKNKSFIIDLKNKISQGLKIYSECGGFMYLTETIKNLAGENYSMIDIFPCSIKMTDRLDISRFGYVKIFDKEKHIANAHEFHYSKFDEIKDDTRIFVAQKKDGREWKTIFNNKNVYGGYPHIHFFTSLDLLKKILES